MYIVRLQELLLNEKNIWALILLISEIIHERSLIRLNEWIKQASNTQLFLHHTNRFFNFQNFLYHCYRGCDIYHHEKSVKEWIEYVTKDCYVDEGRIQRDNIKFRFWDDIRDKSPNRVNLKGDQSTGVTRLFLIVTHGHSTHRKLHKSRWRWGFYFCIHGMNCGYYCPSDQLENMEHIILLWIDQMFSRYLITIVNLDMKVDLAYTKPHKLCSMLDNNLLACSSHEIKVWVGSRKFWLTRQLKKTKWKNMTAKGEIVSEYAQYTLYNHWNMSKPIL